MYSIPDFTIEALHSLIFTCEAKIFPKVFAVTFSFAFALTGFFFATQMNPDTKLVYNSAFQNISSNVSNLDLGGVMQANVFTSLNGFVDGASLAVYHGMNNMFFETRDRILVMSGLESEKKVTSTTQDNEPTGANPNQGVVVVPIDENTNKDATVAKIKDAFSDEISVKPSADNASGVITPVFKKTKGNDYIYVLVPIKN